MLDAGDVELIGERHVPCRVVKRASSGSTMVQIPIGTADGTYHLFACADVDDEVDELNENDNCRTAAATVEVS